MSSSGFPEVNKTAFLSQNVCNFQMYLQRTKEMLIYAYLLKMEQTDLFQYKGTGSQPTTLSAETHAKATLLLHVILA